MVTKSGKHVVLLGKSPEGTPPQVLATPSPRGHNTFCQILMHPDLQDITNALWLPLSICQRPRDNDVIRTCEGASPELLSSPRGPPSIQIWLPWLLYTSYDFIL